MNVELTAGQQSDSGIVYVSNDARYASLRSILRLPSLLFPAPCPPSACRSGSPQEIAEDDRFSLNLVRQVALRVDRNEYLTPFPWRTHPAPTPPPPNPQQPAPPSRKIPLT